MKRITTTLMSTLIAFLLVLSFGFFGPGILSQENRFALVVGNAAYKSSPLRNPVNDAFDMARTLRTLGFEVIHEENANQRTMENAISRFGRQLRKQGGVGLFYFAGHGIQVNGRNYLIPIDAEIETESDVRFEAVDAGRVLGKMEDAGNDLNIVILDACRDNPFARSFRTSSKGLARMDAPKGSLIAYATAPGSVAADGEGRNGIYTKYLLKHMATLGSKVEEVLKQVRVDVINETNEKQIPWEASSLTGEFYFAPKRGIAVVKRPPVEPQHPKRDEGLEEERQQLARERQELERLKMEIERKKLEAERKRLEAEKKKLEVAKLPPKPMIKEIDRDGQFIAYDNGTVKDTSTGLMWASRDNGKNIDWHDAKRYCENYRGGGYTDWRMPTLDELASLYDKKKSGYAPETVSDKTYKVHITKLIHIRSNCPWASETRGSKAAYFNFFDGSWHWNTIVPHYSSLALPVRGGN